MNCESYFNQIALLFEGWEETMIWSCLQGIMGDVTGNLDASAAVISNRDFCFFAGKPDISLVKIATGPLLVPQTEEWAALIAQHYGDRAVQEKRYAILKEPDIFDRTRLQAFVDALPAGYELCAIDKEMVPVLLAAEWSKDFCAAFDSPEDFVRRGLGFAALWDGVPVAGAGTYCIYDGGIEIEIDTREDHRRRGLAAACGARLILECLDKGLYPSWDAHDLRSVALAEKLGYHRGEPYDVFWIGQ